ncbi:MAG: hypothetical protein E4H27_01795 [Anaerolineales bacterium]|nr:MAG: hypothetical protein E4H27_01795 [Anaerolineales bacterium]
MKFKDNLEDSLARWKAFWHREVADRPPMIVRFREGSDNQKLHLPPVETDDFERQFDLSYVCEQVKLAELQFKQRADFPDDTLPQVAGPNGLAVTGWAFGAQVETAAGIPWVRPILHGIDDWHAIDFAAVERRFDQILEIDRVLVSLSRNRYAVSSGSLDGPADMVVRMLGEEKLALALYDRVDEVESLFSHCSTLWHKVVHRKLKVIPIYGGGTATGWNYWVPGKGIALQEDFGQMISPTQFRKMILKHDAQLVNALDCVWYHVHSGALHMAREIASNGAFHGIQITNDYPAGPTIKEMLPILQHIQERTCLILRKFSLDQLDSVIGYLSPKGLAFDLQCFDSKVSDDIQTTLMTRQEAIHVLKWAEEWMGSLSI